MAKETNCDNGNKKKLPKYKVTSRVNLQFKNLTYTTKSGIFRKVKKTILKGVHGEFKSGQLSALMGASGAGKSTLLNVLSGFTTRGVEGEIFDNGQIRNPTEFSNLCSYITQEDKLHPLLKVQEAMNFAADLKLPVSVTKEEKQKRIELILKSLGIFECRDTLTSKISGGQKKRLSIGIELIHNPPVLFLDEPTSGLDEVTAKQIINLLSDIARDGRTVICTIHQPSALLLEKFNHLYCLADGKCTYQGTVKGLLPYLASFEPPLICPNYHNPADFFMEVCRGMYGDVSEALYQRCANGEVSVQDDDEIVKNDYTVINYNKDYTNSEISEFDSEQNLKTKSIYATSFTHQTFVIIKRVYIMMSRDKGLTFYRFFLHIITAIFAGIIFFQIGDDARFTLDNFNFLFFAILFVMYVSFFSMLLAFGNELPIIIMEHFNRWYSVKSYYVGITLADLPVQIILTCIFTTICYTMTGQPMEWFRFSIFIIIVFLNGLVAQAISMLYSAYLKFSTTVVIGPVSLSPFILFCGYIIHIKDAPVFFRWAFDLSFLRYGVEGVIHAVMGYGRGKFQCSDLYCHFLYPHVFMEQIGMSEPRIMLDITVLILFYVFVKIVAYLALLNRISSKN